MSTVTPTKSLSEKPIPLEQRLRRRHRELLSAFDEAKILRTQQNDASAADRLVQLRTELSNLRMQSETKIINAQRQCEIAINKLNTCCVSNNQNNNNNSDLASKAAAATSAATSVSKPSTPALLPNPSYQNNNVLPFGPDDRLPQDDIHGNSSSKPENYEDILSRRRERITQTRLEMTQLAVDLRNEHLFRMEKMDKLEKALFEFEQERQTETERLARELVENIISIAYVNVTQAQSIAQQYLIEENERALANNVGVTSLFSKLRQHELLHFRELMKSMKSVMRKTEERCVKSILVWTMNLLLSRRFREPRGRVDLIEKTREMVTQSGRNLKHIVASITAAAESLPRKPRPTAKVVPLVDIYSTPLPLSESKIPCDVPGGSGDGGWLKHFSLEDPRTPHPFSKRPNEVTAEWTQALETVLDHFGSNSEQLILESQQHGKALNEMVEDIIFSMQQDMSHCFVLGPVEMKLKQTQADEYFPFFEETPVVVAAAPTNELAAVHDEEETATNKTNSRTISREQSTSLHQLNNNNNNNNPSTTTTKSLLESILPPAEASRDEYFYSIPIFFDNINRLQNEIKQENKWFSDFMSLHLLRQFEHANSLIHRNGFFSLCTEATIFLQGIVEKMCSLVRSAVLWQEESQKDFRDNLTRLETAYQITEDRLSSAGTIEEATQLCEQASDLLKKIEQEYISNYGKSESYLQNLVSKKLPQIFDEEGARVFSALCVNPVDLPRLLKEEAEYNAEQKRLQEAIKKEQERRLSPIRGGSPTRKGGAAAGATTTASQQATTSKQGGKGSAASKQQQAQLAAANAVEEKAKQERIAERRRLLKMPNVTSLRGSSYVITAPVESVMELGGSIESYLAEQIEDQALIEEKKNQLKLAANAAAAAAAEEHEEQLAKNAVGGNNNKKGGAGGKGGRGTSKMTKQQKEELDRLKQEELERKELENASKRLLPVEEKYINFLSREFSSIFTPNCILPKSALSSYIILLRSLVLDWFEEYRENITAVSKSYTKTTIDQLSLETHDCIRRHARRPVTLQSQVFEVRIRQLQDAADARADWFQRLLQRVNRGLEHAQRAVADLEMVDASTSATIEDLKEEVCDANTVAGIDAQSRAFNALLGENTNVMHSNLDTIRRRSDETFNAVRSEVESFEVHKLKSLEEGGTLTNAEKEICRKAVRDVYDAIIRAQNDVGDLTSSALNSWNEKRSNWSKEFDELLDLHRKEVTFLREVGEALSKARGAISVLLSQSNGSHARLSRAIDALEIFASGGSSSSSSSRDNSNNNTEFEIPPRGESFAQLKAVFDFSKMSFSTTGVSSQQQQQKNKQSTHHKIYENSQDGVTPIPTDDRIRQDLRQHHIMREKQLCHDSRAAKLSQLVLNLREMFCHRGLSLGCLATLPEWGLSSVPQEWLSLESTLKFMHQSMSLLGLSSGDETSEFANPNNNINKSMIGGGGATKTSGRGGANQQQQQKGGKGAMMNASLNNLGNEASIRNSIGGIIFSELSSPDLLLPPMRSTTTRLEWLAQRILDKTEKEINRLVAIHFSRPPPGTANSQLSSDDQQQAADVSHNKKSSSSMRDGGAGAGGAGGKNMSKKEKEAAAALAAEMAAAQEASMAAANRLSRETEFGQDATSVKERASKLLMDQLGRVTDHVQENTNDFRVLVRKLQVSIHGAVEELFNSLLQFQLGTLNESVRIILDDFAHYYKNILEEQRQIQQNLRAPLASPSHAKEWAALCKREAARRNAAKYELEHVATNFATEVIQCERIANVRVAQALASFFSITKSFILNRHLEGNDSQIPEAGKHRGLRRLLRIKLREELGGPKVVSGDADENNNENSGGKNNKNTAKKPPTSTKGTGSPTSKNANKNFGDKSMMMNKDRDNTGADQQNQQHQNEVPDPVSPPPLNPQAQIPPVALTGLSTGRTKVPGQPQPPSVEDASLQQIQQQISAIEHSTATLSGVKAQQQKELLASLRSQEEAILSRRKKDDADTIAKIIMSVSSSPATWLDDASQNIFKMIVSAALAQKKAADLQQQMLDSGLNDQQQLNTAGARGGAARSSAAAAQQQRQQNLSSRGGGQQQLSDDDGDGTNNSKKEESFFDPSLSFKTPTYASPASAPSQTQQLYNNSIPYPTPSETRIFPVAYSSAQLTIDKMDSIVTEAAEVLYAKLKQFEEVEERWVISWNGAVETLGASGVSLAVSSSSGGGANKNTSDDNSKNTTAGGKGKTGVASSKSAGNKVPPRGK